MKQGDKKGKSKRERWRILYKYEGAFFNIKKKIYIVL